MLLGSRIVGFVLDFAIRRGGVNLSDLHVLESAFGLKSVNELPSFWIGQGSGLCGLVGWVKKIDGKVCLDWWANWSRCVLQSSEIDGKKISEKCRERIESLKELFYKSDFQCSVKGYFRRGFSSF
ncbi:hypothetical protein HQ41_06870 [Porphyromonas sp. COT-290 OH860]|nr:hypothetical protein HQ41_06870 [Porphyromonas sp. COT-290 OH860]